jgi:hypothetical protein
MFQFVRMQDTKSIGDTTKESLRSFASGILQLVKTYLSFQQSEVSDGRYDNFTVERNVSLMVLAVIFD